MNTAFLFVVLVAVAAGAAADDDTWDSTALDEPFDRRQADIWDNTPLGHLFHRREADASWDSWESTALDDLFQRREADDTWDSLDSTALDELFQRREAEATWDSWDSTALDNLFQRRQAGVNCREDPSEQVLRCMSNLEALSHPSSGMPLDQVATPEELNAVCQELHASTACVRRVHEQCGQREDMLVELTYKTMAGVVGHICSDEGKEIILAEVDCWNNRRLAREIERCGNQQGYGNPCRILSRARRCVNRAVRRRCNARAARFVDELVYYALKPMSDTMDCDMQLRVSRSLLQSLPLTRK